MCSSAEIVRSRRSLNARHRVVRSERPAVVSSARQALELRLLARRRIRGASPGSFIETDRIHGYFIDMRAKTSRRAQPSRRSSCRPASRSLRLAGGSGCSQARLEQPIGSSGSATCSQEERSGVARSCAGGTTLARASIASNRRSTARWRRRRPHPSFVRAYTHDRGRTPGRPRVAAHSARCSKRAPTSSPRRRRPCSRGGPERAPESDPQRLDLCPLGPPGCSHRARRRPGAGQMLAASTDCLLATLSSYDVGWWTKYSLYPHRLPDLAKPFYHRLHVDQLDVHAPAYRNRRVSRNRNSVAKL